MRRYIMPGPLGGQELEPIRLDDDGWDFFKWPLGANLSAELRLPARLATPALPEEPVEPLSVVQIGASFFEKRDNAGVNWFDIGGRTWMTWEQVCSVGTPTTLVPDPFAEPVELPWEEVDPEGARARVGYDTDMQMVEVGTSASGCYFHPDEARTMARALMAAADAAEKSRP